MTELENLAYDPELTAGALNAVRTCLRVEPHERVLLITDRHNLEIGASLYAELRTVGAACETFVMEDLGSRPTLTMPAAVLEAVSRCQVGIYCVYAQPGEIASRMQLTRAVERQRLRYAHMVCVDHQIMRTGMRADYVKVDEISERVLHLARGARSMRIRTAAGTDLQVFFNPKLRWIKTSGIITPEYWCNLPAGEVFTTPALVQGTFVIDGTIGDYLCAKYGSLESSPLVVEVEDSVARKVWSANQELEHEFNDYIHTGPDSDRVGEFAIGTNLFLNRIIGNLIQDEKIPGIHLAFGDPYGSQTGADWTSPTHIDVIARRCNVWMDGVPIMEDGHFFVEGAFCFLQDR
jgi:leucyl aminopeptidase (aminopeptidase T)